MGIKAGAAIPISEQTSGPVKAGPAIPVYGYTSAPGDRPVGAGAAMPVKLLSDSDLRQNGGAYVLAGDAQALPVFDAEAGRAVQGTPAQPIYLVGGALGGGVAYDTRVLNTRLANLLGYWPLSDAVGSTVIRSLVQNAGNVLLNSGLEIFATPQFTNWVRQIGGTGTIVQEVADVHAGGSTSAAKVTASSSSWWQTYLNAQFDGNSSRQPVLVIGATYTLTFWSHGDGTNPSKFSIVDNTHSSNLLTQQSTGITGTVYAPYTQTFTVPAGCLSISITFMAGANSAVAYFDDIVLAAPASARPFDATPTNVTLGYYGIGDGKTSALFTGTGYVTFPAAVINAVTNAATTGLINAGTFSCWNAFTEADVWTQAVGSANDKQLFTIYSSATNTVYAYKCGGEHFVNNPIFAYNASNRQAHTNGMDAIGTQFFHFAFTWDIASDSLLCYINGVLNLGEYWGDTSIGAWTAPPSQVTLASFLGARLNKAYMAKAALWNVALSASEIYNLGHT